MVKTKALLTFLLVGSLLLPAAHAGPLLKFRWGGSDQPTATRWKNPKMPALSLFESGKKWGKGEWLVVGAVTAAVVVVIILAADDGGGSSSGGSGGY